MKIVETNYDKFVTDASETTLQQWCHEYIDRMLELGKPVSWITFVWTPIRFVGHATNFSVTRPI